MVALVDPLEGKVDVDRGDHPAFLIIPTRQTGDASAKATKVLEVQKTSAFSPRPLSGFPRTPNEGSTKASSLTRTGT